MLMCPHNSTIHEDFLEISAFGKLGKDSPPDTILFPAGKFLVDEIQLEKTHRVVALLGAYSDDYRHHYN